MNGQKDPTRTYGPSDRVGVPTTLVDAITKRWAMPDHSDDWHVRNLAHAALAAVQDAYRIALPDPARVDVTEGCGRALLVDGPLAGHVLAAPAGAELHVLLDDPAEIGYAVPRIAVYTRHRLPLRDTSSSRRVSVWLWRGVLQ